MLRFFAVLSVVGAVLSGPRAARAEEAERGALCRRGEEGCYLARDGTLRDARTAYDEVVTRGRPHYWRAAFEMGLALGGGTAWYWIDRERQVADWDYPSWKQRLNLEAWRFDNNPFGINFIWHALSGSAFHVASRSNNLGLLASAGYGLATSMSWEYFLEFREKISINDAIVTTGSGVAIGEFFHWLGRYLNSAPAGACPGHGAARWTFGLPQALHNRLDCRGLESGGAPADRLGFRADIWHRFRLSYGLAKAEAAVDQDGSDHRRSLHLHHFRFDGRLAALPGYLRPGSFSRFFADANLPRLVLGITAGGEGTGVDLFADTVLLGLHRQRIPYPDQGGIGHALVIGTSIAYRYRREDFGIWHDRLGLMHLPGLAVDADLVGSRWRLHVAARAHGDFAGLGALPYERWKQVHPDAVEKAILRKQGYYYGWGLSGRLLCELTMPGFAMGGSVFYGRYYSQEGLDRNQEEITFDVRSSDTVLDYEAWLRGIPARGRLYLELRVAHQGRRAELGGFRVREDLNRYALQVGLQF